MSLNAGDVSRSTLAVILLIVLLVAAEPQAPAVARARRTAPAKILVLPIPLDQTWYVCQGYNGQMTHHGVPALDLSLSPRSPGAHGCMAPTRYSSAGSAVSSPAAGIAYRWPGCCGHDFVCVNFDYGGSVAVGHLSARIPNGTRVATGDRIGSVAWPHDSNGNYAHIHVQVHTEPNCTEGSDPVPFEAGHGFRWACTRDLPYSGESNQHSGLAVKRCGSSENAGVQERVAKPDVHVAREWWLSVMRSIRVWARRWTPAVTR